MNILHGPIVFNYNHFVTSKVLAIEVFPLKGKLAIRFECLLVTTNWKCKLFLFYKVLCVLNKSCVWDSLLQDCIKYVIFALFKKILVCLIVLTFSKSTLYYLLYMLKNRCWHKQESCMCSKPFIYCTFKQY